MVADRPVTKFMAQSCPSVLTVLKSPFTPRSTPAKKTDMGPKKPIGCQKVLAQVHGVALASCLLSYLWIYFSY